MRKTANPYEFDVQTDRTDQSYFVHEVGSMSHLEQELGKAYLDYREKWKKATEQKYLLPFPLHIDIELKNACNLRCAMCFRQINTDRKIGGTMSDELFAKIIDECGAKGLPAINFGLGSEPLLSKDLPEKIKTANQKGIIDCMFHSNGMLLDKEMTEKLLHSGLSKAMFSIDAFSKETYDKVRIGGDFDTVMKNVTYFIERRNQLGLKLPIVRVSFVRTKLNEYEVDDFLSYWQGKADYASIQEFVNPSQKLDSGLCPDEHKFSYVPKKFVCEQPWQRLSIDYEGYVYPCCKDYEWVMKMGNVNEQPIEEIWNSTKMNNHRKLHLNGQYHKIPTCRKCVESMNYLF
ncbi:SPASM domain-containing protein [bacterium]|nr:SPASM domain-containing protein [bacterium]